MLFFHIRKIFVSMNYDPHKYQLEENDQLLWIEENVSLCPYLNFTFKYVFAAIQNHIPLCGYEK